VRKDVAIHAAIVAYYPDIETLNRLFAAIAQVAHVLVVANDDGPWSCQLLNKATLIK
jgi:hypothetical protein